MLFAIVTGLEFVTSLQCHHLTCVQEKKHMRKH